MKESDQSCDCLTPQETQFINDNLSALTRKEILAKLKAALQGAIAVEQATIPIYLYTYYSINRTDKSAENIRPIDVFANKAGASIMSVAVEEMLHMSLSCNILYALGGMPNLYLNSPKSYPTPLPLHKPKGPNGPEGEKDADILIPLAKFTYEQMWHFLQIEWPEPPGALPQDKNWQTIGQFYSYIRCLICSPQITDADFQAGGLESHKQQIQHYNYSPNNVDTVSAKGKFNSWGTPSSENQTNSKQKSYPSAAAAASYSNHEDSHEGKYQLISISNKQQALNAILTICHQGEGANFEKWDDKSHEELSHYYKFLSLQAQLEPYIHRVEEIETDNPTPPKPIKPTVTEKELTEIVTNYPNNPTSALYKQYYLDAINANKAKKISVHVDNYQPLNDFCNGVYQYMFILTETIYKVPSDKQKIYFNKSMHFSMIWVLDKLCKTMSNYHVGKGLFLAPSFENINLGQRKDAFQSLLKLAQDTEKWNYYSDIEYLVERCKELPDVSKYWADTAQLSQNYNLVASSGCSTSSGQPGQPVPSPYPYSNEPAFAKNPPNSDNLPSDLPLHACMGLNSCKGSDRYGLTGHEDPKNPGQFIANECAGQGYCSTTVDHNCHVMNECKSQGGCGLYGTADEMSNPANNECKSQGSCATPINAERFSTNGENQGKSVWKRARKVFEGIYPDKAMALKQSGANVAEKLGSVPAAFAATGPTYLWISDDNEKRGNMTACGASGMSGAGGCV